VTCCHAFLITVRGFSGFVALIDQMNEGRDERNFGMSCLALPDSEWFQSSMQWRCLLSSIPGTDGRVRVGVKV
jgi:hypothetical protein